MGNGLDLAQGPQFADPFSTGVLLCCVCESENGFHVFIELSLLLNDSCGLELVVKCVNDGESCPLLWSLVLFLLISGFFSPGSHLHLPSIVVFRYGASFVFIISLGFWRVNSFLFCLVGSAALDMTACPEQDFSKQCGIKLPPYHCLPHPHPNTAGFLSLS